MDTETLIELFEKHEDKYLKDKYIKYTVTKRPDLHAFLIIDQLCPGTCDLISAAEHDTYYISVEFEELAKNITEDHVIELIACGVLYESEYQCLRFNV